MTKYNTLGTPLEDELKSNDFKRFELVNLGESGSGKTTRSLTASQFGPVLVRDFDGKVQGAVRNIPDSLKNEINLKNISVLNCRDMTFDDLLAHTLELIKLSEKGQLPFATIVEDTFTNLSDIVYKSVFTDEKVLFQPNVIQLWGRVGHRTMEIVKLVQTLPCNIIINCHVKTSESGLPEGPAGKGGARDALKGKMTDMHYVTLEQGINKVRVKNSLVPPVNTNINPKYVDPKGYAVKFGLSIFDDFAYKA